MRENPLSNKSVFLVKFIQNRINEKYGYDYIRAKQKEAIFNRFSMYARQESNL